MVKKLSFPSTVLTILKAIPCQMCIYWFSNMDFQFCQPKFGALPVLQKYPQTSHTWDEAEGQQLSHCSNADVYPCYPLMLSCSQFFYNSNPTNNPHSQAGSTKGWVGIGTNWWKCLWDKLTSVPRSHLCRENSEEAASHLSAHWQVQQILHLVSLKHSCHFPSEKLWGGCSTLICAMTSQLNIDCLAVFDQSLDHHSCFTYQT